MSKQQSLDLQEVSPGRAKDLIRLAIAAKRPVMLWGPPGIGKSDVAECVARDTKSIMFDVRLNLMEPTDLKGIPYFDQDTKTLRWAPMGELPPAAKRVDSSELSDIESKAKRLEDPELDAASKSKLGSELAQYFSNQGVVFKDDGTKYILFLDELSAAPPSVQAAAYQLMLNRRVGEYVLPKNVALIAAGNRAQDKGVAFRMPTPLANRMIHLYLKSDFESWFTWAIHSGHMEPDVVGFINSHQDYLNKFDPKMPGEAFCTPRSWHMVSDLLREHRSGKVQPKLNDADFTILLGGTVGTGAATAFAAHLKIASKLPDPKEVLEGRVKKLDEQLDASAHYSFSISLCYMLKELDSELRLQLRESKEFAELNDELHRKFNNYISFAMQSFRDEVVVLALRIAFREYKIKVDPSKLPNFKEFNNKFGKYMQNR